MRRQTPDLPHPKVRTPNRTSEKLMQTTTPKIAPDHRATSDLSPFDDASPICLGSWVEIHEEKTRSGRIRRLLVNHRTKDALSLDEDEAALIKSLEEHAVSCSAPSKTHLLGSSKRAAIWQMPSRLRRLRRSRSPSRTSMSGGPALRGSCVASMSAAGVTSSIRSQSRSRSSSERAVFWPCFQSSAIIAVSTYASRPDTFRSSWVSASSRSPCTKPPTPWW